MISFDESIKKSYRYNSAIYKSSSQWALLKELYERNFVSLNGSPARLPKKIHQIWLGSPFPEKYQKWANTWKKFNPDWEYRLWTDEDVKELDLPNRALYNSICNYGAKSDILRYHIIYKYGGLYVDTDFECLKPMRCLLGLDFVIGVGYPAEVELYVGFIASIPKHPIMEKIVEAINLTSNDLVNKNILSATSSHFFTRNFFSVVKEYTPGVVVLPPDYIYPFPNEKGHERRRGSDYVQPCSIANHHWEVSWAVSLAGRDWIRGERFKEVADFTYAPKEKHPDDYDHLPNTFNPGQLKEGVNIIYTHTMYVKQLFDILKYLPGKFVVVSHNSDINVDESFVIPDNVVRWFTQNVNFINPKVESLPIGLENDHWSKRTNKKGRMVEQLKRTRKWIRLAYMNHSIKTNPGKRAMLYPMFESKPWVTAVRGKNGVNVGSYFSDIFNHKFVFCPEGNGMDTHRTWETLYLGSIPIEKRNLNNQYYTDLPICFVDDWGEVTEEFLNKEFTRINETTWNYEKLNFEYWKNRIKSYAVL